MLPELFSPENIDASFSSIPVVAPVPAAPDAESINCAAWSSNASACSTAAESKVVTALTILVVCLITSEASGPRSPKSPRDSNI